MLRIIIVPNLIASVLIGGITRDRFSELVGRLDILEFIYCDQLIDEIGAFPQKAYFQKKGIDESSVKAFITFYQAFALKVLVTSLVKVGRDRNDHYLLSLSRDARADSLITGDPDLLLLRKYSNTQIVTMKAIIELL
ncbi:putative toxin-antitoxin system toxin component, PIN family [Runella sp.]|uniref:putative toxin-antitoxin system toxin component, PIN family n=1 Tax=Runella sp. TaxID=1960881 RepID=UPI003D0BE12A